MKPLFIARTKKTPEIRFDPDEFLLDINGVSNPEDTLLFYRQVYDWLEDYITAPAEKTTVNVKMDHFNTSSSKCLLEIFRKLEKMYNTNHDVMVNWYYEVDDFDLLDAGDNYAFMVKIPFTMIPYQFEED